MSNHVRPVAAWTLLQGVVSLLGLAAGASCGAPFTASPCAPGKECSTTESPSEAGAAQTNGITSAAGAPSMLDAEGGAAADGGAPGTGSSASGAATSASGGDGTSSAGEPSVMQSSKRPASCAEAHERNPGLADGDVEIDPDGSGGVEPFVAHCDMTSDGGGWTQIGIGEYWQKNDLHLVSDAVLPWAELTALLEVSRHVFRAGAGDLRLYLKDEGAIIEKLNDPAGTNSDQSFLWRTKANNVLCTKSYAALAANEMLTVTTKEVSCDPLAVGKHTCGVAAGWLLFHRNDTTNWSGHPCAFPAGSGGTAVAPTGSALRPLWVR